MYGEEVLLPDAQLNFNALRFKSFITDQSYTYTHIISGFSLWLFATVSLFYNSNKYLQLHLLALFSTLSFFRAPIHARTSTKYAIAAGHLKGSQRRHSTLRIRQVGCTDKARKHPKHPIHPHTNIHTYAQWHQ